MARRKPPVARPGWSSADDPEAVSALGGGARASRRRDAPRSACAALRLLELARPVAGPRRAGGAAPSLDPVLQPAQGAVACFASTSAIAPPIADDERVVLVCERGGERRAGGRALVAPRNRQRDRSARGRGVGAPLRVAESPPKRARASLRCSRDRRHGLFVQPALAGLPLGAAARSRCRGSDRGRAAYGLEEGARERLERRTSAGARSAACSPRSACPRAAEVVGLGLHALQHRGQESAGIVSCDDRRVPQPQGHRAGLRRVRRRRARASSTARSRSATTATRPPGSVTLENTQPLRVVYRGGPLALAHNGNLVNARELRQTARGHGLDLPDHARHRDLPPPDGALRARRSRGRADRGGAAGARRLLAGRADAGRRARAARSPRLPPAVHRPARRRLRGGERDLRARPGGRGVRARRRAGRAGAHRPARHALARAIAAGAARSASACSSTSTSPRPDSRVFGVTVDRVRRAHRPPARRGASGRGRRRDRGARLEQLDRARLQRGDRAFRFELGSDPQPLRRAAPSSSRSQAGAIRACG